MSSLALQAFAGVAMFGGSARCLGYKLPAERARQRRMVAATGVIHDGLQAPNMFKKASAIAQDAQVTALPTVAFVTADGSEALPEVGALRGRGPQRVVSTIDQQVGLKYDPVDPKVAWLDGQPSRTGFAGMLGACLLIIGLLLAHASLRALM